MERTHVVVIELERFDDDRVTWSVAAKSPASSLHMADEIGPFEGEAPLERHLNRLVRYLCWEAGQPVPPAILLHTPERRQPTSRQLTLIPAEGDDDADS